MPDRSIKHVHVVAHALKDETGAIEYVGAVTDVTATKIAEEKMRQDEREIRHIVEAIPQLIMVIAADGRFLYANEAVLEYTGFTQEEIVIAELRQASHSSGGSGMAAGREPARDVARNPV